MTNKHMKICYILLIANIIKGMHLFTSEVSLHTLEWQKQTDHMKYWLTCGGAGNVKQYHHFGSLFSSFLKN